MQNDFVSPKGHLAVTDAEAVLPVINAEVAHATEAGALVVYTQDWHPPETPHFETDGGIWPVHCVQHTWGAELHPDLDIRGEIVTKGESGDDAYSGFTQRNPTSGTEAPTPLESLLRKHDIRRTIVVGIATDVCVKATALDALRLGFETTVLRNATCGVNLHPEDTARAFEELEAAGVALE